MSVNDPSNNPPKRVATKVRMPFLPAPILAMLPAATIFLLAGGIYFSGSPQLMLGLQELRQEDHEAKAIEFFNWAIASNPSMAEAYAQRANARLKLEQQKGLKADYSGPRSDIARAIKLAPKNTEYYGTSMKIEEAAHNFHTAITGYSHIIDDLHDRNQNRNLNKRAGLHYIVGDFKNEKADREQIIKINTARLGSSTPPGKNRPLEARAAQYVFLGETDKAISDYEACFKQDQNPSDLLHVGYLYENSARPSQAIQTYTQLIDTVGKDSEFQVAEARFRRANLYLQSGENEKALADADHLLKYLKSDLHHAFHAKILDTMHRDLAAQAERRAVIDQLNFLVDEVFKDATNDLLAGNYVERARFYAADQQWKKALRDYSIAVSLYPTSAAYIGCAQMYTKLGNYDKAIEFFNKAISPDSRDYEREKAYAELAEVHLLQNKPELAVEDCNKAIKQGTESGEGSYWRAKAYRQLGKDDLAKIDEQEALGLGFSVVPDLD